MTTPQQTLLDALNELIGPDATAKLRAEFGGSQLFIPVDNTPRLSRSPVLRLSGAFSVDVRPEIAVQTVVSAAYALHHGGVNGLGIEVEATGLGHGYAEQLKEALKGTDIKVLARLQLR